MLHNVWLVLLKIIQVKFPNNRCLQCLSCIRIGELKNWRISCEQYRLLIHGFRLWNNWLIDFHIMSRFALVTLGIAWSTCNIANQFFNSHDLSILDFEFLHVGFIKSKFFVCKLSFSLDFKLFDSCLLNFCKILKGWANDESLENKQKML